MLQHLAAEQRGARRIGEHVLGLVDEALRLGLDLGRTLSASAISLASAAAFSAISTSIGLAPVGGLGLAHGLDLFLGLRGGGAGGIGLGAGGTFLQRFLVKRDGLLHLRRLDLALALDLETAAFGLVADADFVQPAFRGDARAFDILAAADLGLAQRLHARDLELLDGAAAFQLGGLDACSRATSAASTSRCGGDLGLLDAGFRRRRARLLDRQARRPVPRRRPRPPAGARCR
jgi:hypothetical protein